MRAVQICRGTKLVDKQETKQDSLRAVQICRGTKRDTRYTLVGKAYRLQVVEIKSKCI